MANRTNTKVTRQISRPRNIVFYRESGGSPIYKTPELMREDTRSKIALKFIYGYLIIIFVLIILSTFFGLMNDKAKDFLLAISSPLGFIIGYYFKSEK